MSEQTPDVRQDGKDDVRGESVLSEATQIELVKSLWNAGRAVRKRIGRTFNKVEALPSFPCQTCKGSMGLVGVGEGKKFCSKKCRKNR
jgi:hypothetical protein